MNTTRQSFLKRRRARRQQRRQPPHPLDHDRNGRKGGSLPAPADELAALRAEAAALGLTFSNKLRAPGLRKAIAQAREAAR